MTIDKIWVEDFEVLENNGQIGINMKIENNEPIESARLVYDGRNCAILIRNKKQAYILINLLPDIREKILNSQEIMIIESGDADIIDSYMCEVSRVPEIPCEDTIPQALKEMLSDLKEAYGEEGCAALARKFWGIQ